MKKAWKKPYLVGVVRGSDEERVLVACKYNGDVGQTGANAVHFRCGLGPVGDISCDSICSAPAPSWPYFLGPLDRP